MADVLKAKGYHYQFVFAKNSGHTDGRSSHTPTRKRSNGSGRTTRPGDQDGSSAPPLPAYRSLGGARDGKRGRPPPADVLSRITPEVSLAVLPQGGPGHLAERVGERGSGR